jgi:hypothetical protein
MLEHLKRLVARLRTWDDLPPMSPPDGPDTGVRHPRGTPRSGGRLAAAVDEPDDDRAAVEAVGRRAS